MWFQSLSQFDLNIFVVERWLLKLDTICSTVHGIYFSAAMSVRIPFCGFDAKTTHALVHLTIAQEPCVFLLVLTTCGIVTF